MHTQEASTVRRKPSNRTLLTEAKGEELARESSLDVAFCGFLGMAVE